MTLFDKREQAFEGLFVRQEDRRFRVRTRRNLLLAGWACERMRLDRQTAERFTEAFTDAGVVTADEPLLARLREELRAAGVEETLPTLRAEMERCAALAQAQESLGLALDQGSAGAGAQTPGSQRGEEAGETP